MLLNNISNFPLKNPLEGRASMRSYQNCKWSWDGGFRGKNRSACAVLCCDVDRLLARRIQKTVWLRKPKRKLPEVSFHIPFIHLFQYTVPGNTCQNHLILFHRNWTNYGQFDEASSTREKLDWRGTQEYSSLIKLRLFFKLKPRWGYWVPPW